MGDDEGELPRTLTTTLRSPSAIAHHLRWKGYELEAARQERSGIEPLVTRDATWRESFLCVGTTSVGGPTPTDGSNAAGADADAADRRRRRCAVNSVSRPRPCAAGSFDRSIVGESR